MNPKYSVGESVILQSISRPEYNGEYTVEKVLKNGDSYVCRETGLLITRTNKPGFGYILNELVVTNINSLGMIVETGWKESALRKRHEPSQMSFQSLIQSINSPVKQES